MLERRVGRRMLRGGAVPGRGRGGRRPSRHHDRSCHGTNLPPSFRPGRSAGTVRRTAALIVALLLASPAVAQPAEPPRELPPISLQSDDRTDAAIAARARQLAAALGYDEVAVASEGGIITLSGSTPEDADGTTLAGLVERIEGVAAVRNEVEGSADVAERLDPALQRVVERARRGVAYLPLAAVALLLGAAIAGTGALAAAAMPWARIAPNPFIAGIYRQILRLIFLVTGVVVALDFLGATALLGTILGAAGIVGLAVGFAVRDTVENFIASVMLSIRQPFRPNDLVEIEGDLGHVIRLTSRATVLLSIDGNHVRIPNATVFKSRIVNFTRNDTRRFEATIGVDPAADLDGVRKLVQRTVEGLDFVLAEPAPLVWLDALTEGGAILRFAAWIDQTRTDFFKARGEALRVVKDVVEASGVEVPDTTYRIRLDTGGPPVTSEVGAPAHRAPAAPHDVKAPAPTAPDEQEALGRLVQAERQQTAARDLLDPAAPEE